MFDAHNYFAQRTRADGSRSAEAAPPPRTSSAAPSAGRSTCRAYKGTNRTFFFADYSGLKETRGLSFVNTVPTAAQRNGDFSDFRNPTTGALIVIYDPLTTRPEPDYPAPVSATNPQFLRDPFPGNVIPQDRINPVGRNVASIYPEPNQPGTFNNYLNTSNREVTENQVTGRVDHRLSDASRSSSASPTASSSSTRRRARRPAVCRRRSRRRPASTSAPTSPASRTPA